MFCPKCGTKNPDDGKFCRKCGIELEPVSELLSGKIQTLKRDSKGKPKRKPRWESAITPIFAGLAMLIISIILAVTGAGRYWWFWLLIPAFGAIGSGVSNLIQIKQDRDENDSTTQTDETTQIAYHRQSELPPSQTEYVSPKIEKRYEIGNLVPPSVIEDTTRHLEIDEEGKTMTLPEDKV